MYPIVALRDISQDARKHMPEEDFAGKGRSFPIETPEDVHTAAQSIGRAGDDNYSTDELKARIKAIAKRKGKEFEARLPDAWKGQIDACDTPHMAMSDAGPRWYVRLAADAPALKRIPIAVLGKFVKGNQKFSITRQTLADLVANFRRSPVDTVIDYDHASEFPGDAKGQPIPAGGWIKRLDDAADGQGILWGEAEFTPRAQEMIRNGEYRYFSPVINYGARDKHSGEPQGATLVSGALTNRPFLEEMPALVASTRERGKERSSKTVKVIMADRAAGTARVIADDNTEQTLRIEGLEAPPRIVRLSDVRRDSKGNLDFSSLPHDENTLIASDVFRGMQVQAALDDAIAAGKILPAQRGHYEKLALSDLASFNTLVESMKPQVDLREHGTSAEGLTGVQQIDAAIAVKVAEKRKANPGLGYSTALKLVASENADLFIQKNRLARGGR